MKPLADLHAIGHHAATIWIGQLAVMAFAITDTLITGRHSPDSLAALSVGTAIYISIYIGLQGFIQALLPLWAHLHGANQPVALGASVRQSLYICLGCTVLGVVVLLQSGPLMQLAGVPATLQLQVRQYLAIQALTLPLALLARSFNTFSQSIGSPQWVTRLQAGALLIKIPLSIWFAFGGLGMPALGLAGCAWATFIAHVVMLLVVAWLLRRSPMYAPYRIWQRPERWHTPTLRHFMQLGLPSSLAIWVEVTSFTMMSLLVAPMGTTAAAAQQIASNMAAVLYMWPLSLAIATSARVSYWRGAQQLQQAAGVVRTGLLLAGGSALLVALGAWLGRHAVAGWYTAQPEVVVLAASLLPWVALYHLADAMQTMGLFVLRCFHVVRTPAVIYTVLLWGMGLGGGYWLAYGNTQLADASWHNPQAFWVASAAALWLVALLFMVLLRWLLRLPARW